MALPMALPPRRREEGAYLHRMADETRGRREALSLLTFCMTWMPSSAGGGLIGGATVGSVAEAWVG